MSREYSFVLDEAEIARYRAMAAAAAQAEGDLWELAGIRAGANVADLGCGPGILLPLLVERTSSGGSVTAVERSDDALKAARSLLRATNLEDKVRIVQADAAATGLQPSSIDVVMIRNVLMHNGPRLGQILAHLRDLLAPGGALLAVEAAEEDIRFSGLTAEEKELEERWIRMMQAQGNDPNIGRPLADLVGGHRFSVIATRTHTDQIAVQRSPAWTARDMIVEKGFASEEDVGRWGAAIDHRLRTTGQLRGEVPFTVVVARPK